MNEVKTEERRKTKMRKEITERMRKRKGERAEAQTKPNITFRFMAY